MKTDPNKLPNHTIWARLTARFRRSQPTDDSAPLGFATRVVARYQELRRNELFAAWERLSIRAAIGAVCVAALFVGYAQFNEASELEEEMLIELPMDELNPELL